MKGSNPIYNNHKEWGGYLPLESTMSYNRGTGRFGNYSTGDVIALNSARNAICYVMKKCRFRRIWIPVYMCESIKDSLERNGIDFVLYNIDDSFTPQIASIPGEDAILICNYFGIQVDSFYDEMQRRYAHIVFDNTQSFFREPVISDGVYYIYSPRKFIGVSDGAYIVGKGINASSPDVAFSLNGLSKDISYDRGIYLLRSYETSTNECYGCYLESERSLDDEIKLMSAFTESVLDHVDYNNVNSIRLDNYNVLRNRLDRYNELKVDECYASPMVYPLLIEKDGLRKRLVDAKIYVPQWWKWVLEEEQANEWEVYLSKWLLPIPIDQRYTEQDMDMLAETIFNLL